MIITGPVQLARAVLPTLFAGNDEPSLRMCMPAVRWLYVAQLALSTSVIVYL